MAGETEESGKGDYASLHFRVKLLEETMAGEVIPKLNKCYTDIAEIHAKNDEMYSAFIMARNGVRVITKTGDGIMWFADKTERLGKPLLYLAIICGGMWTGLKVPDWLANLLKFLG